MSLLIFPLIKTFVKIFTKSIFQFVIFLTIFECHYLDIANPPGKPYQSRTTSENATNEYTPIVTSARNQLPDCINVTVNKKYFINTTEELSLAIGYNIESISNYHITPDGNFIILCFPLSPQMLYCDLTKTGQHEYKIHENQTLIINGTYNAELGDYYIDDVGYAYSCSQVIRTNRKMPRCNYHKISHENDTKFNNQIFLNATQTMINRPQYRLGEDGATYVCHPLSIDFINCKTERLYHVSSQTYEIRSNTTIWYAHHNRLLTNGDFYRYKNGDVLICISKKVVDDLDLVFLISAILYFISAICLLLAIIYQITFVKLNAYSKCLIGHYVSMLVFYISAIIGYLNLNVFMNGISSYTFIISLSVFYFISTATLSWTTVAAFDLWHSFCKSSITNTGGCACYFRLNKRNAFIYYNIYVWTVSILMSILGIIAAQFHNEEMIMENIYRDFYWEILPHIAYCMLLCVINAVFYLLTFNLIRNGSQGTELVNKNVNKDLLIISWRLFFIMGIHWMAEVIAFMTINYFYFTYTYSLSLIVALQGVACLIEILLRRGARSEIRKALEKLKKKLI